MKVCPNCGVENDDDKLACSNCGRPISETVTLRSRAFKLPIVPPNVAGGVHLTAHVGKLPEKGIAIYIGDTTEPIITTIKTKLVLGRRRELLDPELLDLTPYDAYKLGLSRNHAVLFFKDGSLCVQDTGSSNGTWVNNTRLQAYDIVALLPGSVVSLAEMAMIIYY